MRIETKGDLARAIDRLAQRDPVDLVRFIVSLAHDSGPVGDQVRTFIVGDDVEETAESIRQRIGDLETPSEYEHRHSRGQEVGDKLGFILESIERLVLPVDPKAAFELLVGVFEADGRAMENCGDHDWEVRCAFKSAAELMAEAGNGMSREEVIAKIRALMAADGYGMRGVLAAVIGQSDDAG